MHAMLHMRTDRPLSLLDEPLLDGAAVVVRERRQLGHECLERLRPLLCGHTHAASDQAAACGRTADTATLGSGTLCTSSALGVPLGTRNQSWSAS